MRDHFSILHNGDVILCCIDFEGKTTVGNLRHSSLREILSSDELGKIMDGFRRFQLVHPTASSVWEANPSAPGFLNPCSLLQHSRCSSLFLQTRENL